VGRNLLALRERVPGIRLQGVDVNAEAVAFGRRERGLDLLHGDENFLKAQVDNGFDVIFTVSVLDHLPDPLPILREMVRVARLGVLLLEPSLSEEGKLVKCVNPEPEDVIEVTPYSYFWNYTRLFSTLPGHFSKQHYPLEGTRLGPYYWLFRLLKN
jgi:ubiquinone/menaquinone biosynthesis C-methylase UbiE